MPVTPGEARQKKSDKIKPIAEKFYEIIDEKLCSEEWPVEIVLSGVSQDILTHIFNTYLNKGWSVTQIGNTLIMNEYLPTYQEKD